MNDLTSHHPDRETDSPSGGEYLVYRRHPVNLLAPAAFAVLVILLIITLSAVLVVIGILPMPAALPFIVLYIGVSVFMAISYFFMWWSFWFLDIWVVNEDSLVDSQLVALFIRRRSTLSLRQVQNVTHSIIGTLATLFNFGDVLIQSAATEGSFRMASIKNPGEAEIKIQRLVEAASKVQFQPSASTHHTVPLGERLVQAGLISPADLASALSEQAATGKRVGDILVERGLLKRSDLVTALSSQYRIPEIDISRYEIDRSAIQHISYEIAQKYTVIPVSHTNKGILVAIAAPSEAVMNEIRGMVNLPIDFVVADEDYIKEAIRGYYLATDQGASYSG